VRLAFVLLSVSLAACGEGSSFDNSFRQSYRTKGIESCVAGARSRPGAGAAGIDFERVCACMIDRTMAGKSPTELMRTPDDAESQRIADQCIAETQSGAKPAN
jgi:hypothetical protein